jgi:hypothetical protein
MINSGVSSEEAISIGDDDSLREIKLLRWMSKRSNMVRGD